jgi:NIMA (never in mitosis gene a)-related kinase 1/4/5
MDRYTVIQKIGEGSFGKAFLVKSKADDKQLVLKEVDMTKVGTRKL